MSTGFNFKKNCILSYLTAQCMQCAVEECNLHRRIGLRVLLLVGSTPSMVFLVPRSALINKIDNKILSISIFLCFVKVLLGFMLPTALLSMWISNTASTAMMVKITRNSLIIPITRFTKMTRQSPSPDSHFGGGSC